MKVRFTDGPFNLKVKHKCKRFCGIIKPKDMILEIDMETAGLIYDQYHKQLMELARYPND